MASSVSVVIKPLLDNRSLEGACRLHLSPESLEHANLRLGDVCEIEAEDGTLRGHAIAWRAADNMRSGKTNDKPAKMSEMLREALQVPENARVRIKKTSTTLCHATKITLRDVTPPEYVKAQENTADDNLWRTRSCYILATCEAFANGMTFDVTGAKKTNKKRYKIEDIQGSGRHGSIYHFNDYTDVIFDNIKTASNGVTASTTPTKSVPPAERIGGLIDQLQALNIRIRWLLEDVTEERHHLLGDCVNEGILIYGFEGTGKTQMMKWLEHAPVRKVVHLNPSIVAGSSSSKTVESVRSSFKDAEANQPSLILMDDVHRLVEKNKDALIDVITEEMGRLEGSRVLVIATCRNPADLDGALVCPRRLSDFIECPIPDRLARSQILAVLLRDVLKMDGVIDFGALNSHGYTGRDLDKLVMVACKNSKLRCEKAIAKGPHEFVVESITPTDHNNHAIQTDGHDNTTVQANGICSHLLTTDDITTALRQIRPTALREIFFEPPKIGWNDIGGSNIIKERFDKTIGYSIHQTAMMHRLHLQPPKGILLFGPPGCSKTLTAQAVASHYGLNFITVKGSEMVSMYVGESERAIRELFRKARQAAPCVIFFDEIDSIASERETGSSKGLNVLTTLLNEMDGFEALNGVLVLAATNKPEVLDPAIMRPGRFGSHVYLGPPDAGARREILNINLRHLPGAEGMHMEGLVEGTDGYSGAEIVQICQSAIYKVAERYLQSGDETLRIEDLQSALHEQKRSITPEMLASYAAFAAR